ncbi:MAG: deoxyribodipyrimidine photo-lyase, partial [Alphaproteobacteria bacterium]|nr:deoxyribodipyrimidine photo-lyase [Alphaproteobacteria bacterium]
MTTKAEAAPVILWFRQDLRLADNPALAAAVATGRPVLPV